MTVDEQIKELQKQVEELNKVKSDVLTKHGEWLSWKTWLDGAMTAKSIAIIAAGLVLIVIGWKNLEAIQANVEATIVKKLSDPSDEYSEDFFRIVNDQLKKTSGLSLVKVYEANDLERGQDSTLLFRFQQHLIAEKPGDFLILATMATSGKGEGISTLQLLVRKLNSGDFLAIDAKLPLDSNPPLIRTDSTHDFRLIPESNDPKDGFAVKEIVVGRQTVGYIPRLFVYRLGVD